MAWDGLRRDGRLNPHVNRQGAFPIQLRDVRQMQTEVKTLSKHFRLKTCMTRNELETPREQAGLNLGGSTVDCPN
jgi:hypothetical protein